MVSHYKYFRYLFLHKWYVFISGLKVKAPLWNLIIHDWSKFLPSEWFPYMNYFYGNLYNDEEMKKCERVLGYCNPKYSEFYWKKQFDIAWSKHIHRSPHHFQHWILHEDSGAIKILDIPDGILREMISDWAGAGKAITGRWEVKEWYYKNKENIKLSENTRRKVEELLEKF